MKFKIEIKSRWSDAVLASVEIDAANNASDSVKLGKAILQALANGANLIGADLRSADLTGADLTGADLIGADLTGADLTGANLTGADLIGADLPGANLTGADLRSANLRSADLTGADLSGANLRSANLRSADLPGANLTGADLYGAVGKVVSYVASVTRSDGYLFIGFVCEDKSLGIIAGCQNRTLASYRKHVAEDYVERSNGAALAEETTAILDFLERRHAAIVKAVK